MEFLENKNIEERKAALNTFGNHTIDSKWWNNERAESKIRSFYLN